MELKFKRKLKEKPIKLECCEVYEVIDGDERKIVFVASEEIIYLNETGRVNWSSKAGFEGKIIRKVTNKITIEVD